MQADIAKKAVLGIAQDLQRGTDTPQRWLCGAVQPHKTMLSNRLVIVLPAPLASTEVDQNTQTCGRRKETHVVIRDTDHWGARRNKRARMHLDTHAYVEKTKEAE